MIDLVAVLISLTLVVVYHYVLHVRVKRDPLYTVHGVNLATRAAWVDSVMASGKSDVLAVQTLRNSVMASSFMASTAILLLIGALSLSASSDQSASLWHGLNVSGAINDQIITLKLICLVLNFFIAFFCFSMAVRFYNHVGYMISIPIECESPARSSALATAYLNRAGLFYLLGLRSFFFAVPLVFWMFGPHFMVAATLGLIAALFPLDRAPRARIQAARASSPTAQASMPASAASASPLITLDRDQPR